MAASTTLSSRRRWDSGIAPILQPLVRAYLFGYAYAIGPRLLTLLLQHAARYRRRNKQTTTTHEPQTKTQQIQSDESFLAALRRIFLAPLDKQSFPTFCAALIGGTTILELPLRSLFERHAGSTPAILRRRLSRWVASFIAAWMSLRLLQSKQTPSFTEVTPSEPGQDEEPQTVEYAGRTLDLTLFAFTRALDVVVGELWHRRRTRRVAAGKWTALERAVSRFADPAVFALSSGLVMWTWFYHPPRLPRAYNKWISSAAAVDSRLIEALRRCRQRTLLYGRDTGQADLLGGMCADYGWPAAWGDPARSVPFPCEMVHMGCGPSCEWHALSRFARSFRWAMTSYLPLSLLLALRSGGGRTRNPKTTRQAALLTTLRRITLSASRSSAFLAAFITLFYYGVCLARTRIGPHILSKTTAARQTIDGGLCVGAGCVLCGWSILLENAGRRKDMALFVAPRALATLFPRRYALEKQWRETVVFAVSTAVVMTCFREKPGRVRGMMGGVLGSVFRE
ncbi:integral membrane protein [Chaetomium tenue]|uniref:Integral membrane protein n=1 Tax=Chaetomium tenue TaxID=1854479 RepID=A0ACB7PK05_9PEZI|nr:integral membrane protein [Chaetomium globosum]